MNKALNSRGEEAEDQTINTLTYMRQDNDRVVTGDKQNLTGARWKEMTISIEMNYKDSSEARTSPQ